VNMGRVTILYYTIHFIKNIRKPSLYPTDIGSATVIDTVRLIQRSYKLT